MSYDADDTDADEHVMQVTDRHGRCRKMLLMSHESVPPTASSPPLPQRATPDKRILCALVNRI